MDAIRLKNLQSLTDTGAVNLKSINLLVGQNSSGKSTFLRVFPLLKQSIETDTISPILWYGNLVDFGTFKDAHSRNATSSTISFEMTSTIDLGNRNMHFASRRLVSNTALDRLQVKVLLEVEETSRHDYTRPKSIALTFLENDVSFELDSSSRVSAVRINTRNVSDLFEDVQFIQRNSLLPSFASKRKRRGPLDVDSTIYDRLFSELKRVSRSRTTENIEDIISALQLSSRAQMLEQLKELNPPTPTWKSQVDTWEVTNSDFALIYDLVIARFTELIYELAEYYLYATIQNFNYIAPLRASAERYYRVQGLAVREVDAQGLNLAMFIRNLSTDMRRRLNSWLLENFDFELMAQLDGGHLSLKLKQPGTSELTNLADMGFGFSQLIPILVQLWVMSSRHRTVRQRASSYVFAIEQPELHLHPRLQAKLADVFIASIQAAEKIRVDLKLILETHSETMINRFGSRIADGDFRHDNISVILFEKDTASSQSIVTSTGYDKEGILVQWPYGFFEPEQ